MANRPKVGVVLGSGLGAFADTLADRLETPYAEIQGWPQSTAAGHAGKLAAGRIGETEVIVLSGRSHLYEGYSAAQVTFGIRELARRGVNSLVLISDHINLLGVNPLTGPNDETLGPRFPDMSDAYSREYREIAKHAAAELGITLREGVYAAVPGPSYETPAEIRYLRTIGADLVGMSTVPETIVANHMGMKVLAISCVTNMAAGILPKKLTHAEVLETGERVKETLAKLLHAVVTRLPAQ